ncbi:SCO family protein [Aquitalea sp. S1-19]|nr:SCO family protein [Aquitalea sp. S1-19]
MLRRVLFCCCLLALMACTPQSAAPAFKGSDISGVAFGGNFTLTNQQGKTVSLADFRGKAVALFFGYTHCPDVCPTTLLEYAQAMKALGPQADRVQVLFVSLDPARDTPAVLAAYVPHFDRRFIGLTGSQTQVDRVATQFKVVAQKVATEGGGYTLDHSAGSYLFDGAGNLRVYQAYGTPSAALVHDIRELLR